MLALSTRQLSFTPPTSAMRAPMSVRSTHIRCLTLEEVQSDSGVTVMPIPGGYFDPAGLLGTQAQIDKRYSHYKEVEIKHGRIAMRECSGSRTHAAATLSLSCTYWLCELQLRTCKSSPHAFG